MTFVTNRWVRGDDFFGRQAILDDVAQRLHRPIWLLGNRRAGKTSLLRQIEYLCDSNKWPKAQALFWDIQGAGSSDGLKESILESLEDKPPLLETLDLTIEELEQASFPEICLRLRRKVRQSSLARLIILIDEIEELVEIAAQEPQVLSAFRKLQDNGQRVTMILSGSLRLLDMDETASRTSPFLPDFMPPLLLEPFSEQETRALLSHGGIEGDLGSKIYQATFGNPHLVQSLGDRTHRLQDLDKAIEDLRHHNVLDYFFRSNFACLKMPYRKWWHDDDLLQRLEQISPQHRDYPYLKQSALVRPQDGRNNSINPLLRIIRETGRTTMELPADMPQDEVDGLAGVFELIEAIRSRDIPLNCLPPSVFEGDIDQVRSAAPMPNLNILYSTGEDHKKLHAVLNGASPEYVSGKEADSRTSVFLVGVYLFRQEFGRSLFDDLEDPWDRADKLADQDVGIPTRSQSEKKVDAKLGMILLRCLRAHPEHRYADLDQLAADLLGRHA
ncbi:MAG: AAA family ATPase [Acidobacteria bacterium]|nr:AAA family ATPase [Acidobacteriota bacterium]